MTDEPTPPRSPGPFEAVDRLALVDNDVAPELQTALPEFVHAAKIVRRPTRPAEQWEPAVPVMPRKGPKASAAPVLAVRRAGAIGRLLIMLLVPVLLIALGFAAAKVAGGFSNPQVGVHNPDAPSPSAPAKPSTGRK